MLEIPAICKDGCGNVFAGAKFIDTKGTVTIEKGLKIICPKCNANAEILSGTFLSDNNLHNQILFASQFFSHLLGRDLTNISTGEHGLIGDYFIELTDFVIRQYEHKAKQSLVKLIQLHNELTVVKHEFTHQKDVFTNFVSGLTSSDPFNGYGARSELSVLFFLVQSFVLDFGFSLENITKRESPDFEVKTPEGIVYLEVTHTVVREAKEGKMGYKITRAIRAKSKKSYANRETILFLDITNIVFQEVRAGRDIRGLRHYAEETLKTSKFGALVLIYGMFSIEDDKYLLGFIPFLNKGVSEPVKSFITRHYSYEERNRRAYSMFKT